MELSGKQKRFLRGLGHGLKPIITVGKNEVNAALVQQTDEALSTHELVKIKILESCLLDRHGVADELAATCGAQVAQVLGRTILLYRPATEPKLELPKSKK